MPLARHQVGFGQSLLRTLSRVAHKSTPRGQEHEENHRQSCPGTLSPDSESESSSQKSGTPVATAGDQPTTPLATALSHEAFSHQTRPFAQRRVETLRVKKDRLLQAYLYDQAIDHATYDRENLRSARS